MNSKIVTIETSVPGFNGKSMANFEYTKGMSIDVDLMKDEEQIINASALSTLTGIDVTGEGSVLLSVGEMKAEGSILSISGINESPSNIKIKNIGAKVDNVRISGITIDSPQTGKATLVVSDRNYGQTVLKGMLTAGPFEMNGKPLLLLDDAVSQNTIFIMDAGIYDQNGDKYVYNPNDSNMQTTFADGGVQYGSYKQVYGPIMAHALQRCINEVKGINYCFVEYVDDRFNIYFNGQNERVTRIVNQPGADIIATRLGLQGATYYPASPDITGCVLEIGGNEYPILSSKGDTIVIDISSVSSEDIYPIIDCASAPDIYEATHLICATSGYYHIYTDKNNPTKKTKVMLMSGQYNMPCWKVTGGSDANIAEQGLIYLQKANYDPINYKSQTKTLYTFPWDNDGYASIVQKKDIKIKVYLCGE